MKVYIRAAACISPQKTFDTEGFLSDVVEYHTIRLDTIEPDYKQYIDPKLIRRMSHVIKMGVATAKSCLAKANITMPGAIITGSALGCIQDTITFLTRIVEQNEELLPPTAFIQSTHNTVAAQIALMLQCHNYNNAFVHKGISFESALVDALMLLKEQAANDILVGGIEEMTDTSFKVLRRLGLFRRLPVSNLALLSNPAKGSIGGEGAAFFLLSDKASDGTIAELQGIRTLYKPKSVEDGILSFLTSHALTIGDIDLVITGKNGDVRNDDIYNTLGNSLFKNNSLANYKHLCGEYPTASSFALWMAANIVGGNVVPAAVMERNSNLASAQKVLIYNHYQHKYHSLMLVSAV